MSALRRSGSSFIPWRLVGALAAVGVLATPSARAQEAPPAEPAAESKPVVSDGADAEPVEALPDLDELLGLPPEKKPEDAGPTPEDLELERALRAQQVSEMFQQAVQQMGDAASRLRSAGDAGLTTQRVQQEIITKLEKLIEEAEQQQQQQSSSSSSSSQQQQQQQQKQPQQSQQSQQQPSEQRRGDNRGENTPPGFQQANLSGEIDALRAAWGSLPARVRDALLQGAGDTYSSLYQSLTEAYYKRLAEQDKEPR